MNVICFGDSITEGSGSSEGDRWPAVLARLLDEWKPGVFTVHNRGVAGDTTAAGLDRVHRDVEPLLPGVLLVEFGFNDANCRPCSMKPLVSMAEFEANLREFGRTARASGGEVVYIACHPVGPNAAKQGDGRQYAERVREYMDRVRAVARDLGAPVADIPAMMAERGVGLETMLRDCVHLSPVGNREFAAMVFERLREVPVMRQAGR